jgi:hypothetical protein
MSFVDWYYPQPVDNTDEAEKDREKIDDTDISKLTPVAFEGGDDSQDSFQSGVARTFGQGSDIDIGKLSMVSAQDIKYTDFNTYLDAQGLPARTGFFSQTDFSKLNTGQSFGSKFVSKGVGPTASLLGQPPATSAMVGLVGAALQPSRTVSDPTGKSKRHIPDSGILNAIASMNIAEEYKDLGAIKTATEKLGGSGTRFQKGSVIHMNGRPIYRLPNQRYWKHKIQGVGQISELQGNNLERIAMAPAIQDAIISAMNNIGIGDDPNTGPIPPLGGVNATFAATPNGGYNLSGSFNYGGQTTSYYGNEEDMAAMGASFFGHIEGKATQYSYAETVIRGLRSMPSSVGEKERLTFIEGIVNKSKDGLKPSQIIAASVEADKKQAEAVKTAEAAKAAAKAAGNPSMAQGYEGDYASGVEGGLEGEMSRDEQASEYSDTGDYDDGGYDGDFSQGGNIKGYAEGDMIEGEQATAPGDSIITANEAIEGNESGFIQAPPSQVAEADTVADDVPMNGDVGGEIINASAVAEAGEADIAKMIADAEKYAREKGIEISEDEEKSGIQVSAGEVYVKKDLIPIIGRDKIRKINNRGKKDTDRKIKQTQQVQMAAEGGFIKKKFAEGDMITLYRGEPLDPSKVTPTDYGYGKENVGKYHTPDVKKAGRFAAGSGKGNQVIKSRKATIDEMFNGVKEAFRTEAKKDTKYFAKMPKSELNKNLRFVDTLKKAYLTGERSLDDITFFLQEQVFHDDKSRINFIETFKNDPKSAGKLAGRAIVKVATVATPPLAVLASAAEMLTPSSLGKGTLYDDSFMNYKFTPKK